MKATSLASSTHLSGTSKPTFLDGVAKNALLGRLDQLAVGELILKDGKKTRYFGPGGVGALRATITVRDPRFYSEIAFGGSIGGGARPER